jgi:hypothetical protein
LFEVLIQINKFLVSRLQGPFIPENLLIKTPYSFKKKDHRSDSDKQHCVDTAAERSHGFPEGILPEKQNHLLEDVANRPGYGEEGKPIANPHQEFPHDVGGILLLQPTDIVKAPKR